MPKLTTAQSVRIKDEMLRQDISIQDLAAAVGCSTGGLKHVLACRDPISEERTSKIFETLGIPVGIQTLVTSEGCFSEPEDEPSGPVAEPTKPEPPPVPPQPTNPKTPQVPDQALMVRVGSLEANFHDLKRQVMGNLEANREAIEEVFRLKQESDAYLVGKLDQLQSWACTQEAVVELLRDYVNELKREWASLGGNRVKSLVGIEEAIEKLEAEVSSGRTAIEPLDDLHAMREFEIHARRFRERCPFLFQAACNRVVAMGRVS